MNDIKGGLDWRVELWSPDGVLVVVSNYHEGATIPDDLGEDLREAVDKYRGKHESISGM